MRAPLHIIVTLLLAMAILPLSGYAASAPSSSSDEPPCMMADSAMVEQADGGCVQPGCDECSSCTLCGHCTAGAAIAATTSSSTVFSTEHFLQENTRVFSTYPPVDSPPPRLS